MKKIFVVLLAVLVTNTAFTQDGNLKKKTYIRFGMSIPTWKSFGNNNKSDFPDDTKRMGGIFEVGSIFMLNSIKIMDGMRIGINVDYLSIGLNKFTMAGNNFSNQFIYAGSKIGPSFSYSPVKHLVFDAFVKFNPVWIAGDYQNDKTDDTNNQLYIGYMGMKYSVGLNIRYSVLMLGFEFNPGYAKLRYYDKDNHKLTNEYWLTSNNSKKLPVPCLNMTLGLNF
jgi:hypothetical protein